MQETYTNIEANKFKDFPRNIFFNVAIPKILENIRTEGFDYKTSYRLNGVDLRQGQSGMFQLSIRSCLKGNLRGWDNILYVPGVHQDRSNMPQMFIFIKAVIGQFG